MKQTPTVWVLMDDSPGNVSQALGVAEALGWPFETKKVSYTAAARLPNLLRGASRIGLTVQSESILRPPWPSIVVAAGRRIAPVARWIKKEAQEPVFLAQIMYPGHAGASEFDLIAVPNHDCDLGHKNAKDEQNIVFMTGAPHQLNERRLRDEVSKWAGLINKLPRPYITVLIGGATRSRPFPIDKVKDVVTRVSSMAATVDGSVLLSTSRRTGSIAEELILSSLREPRSVHLWGKGGENPYYAYLALADYVVVTGDSVSMCSEACATQGPVYIYAPEGMTSPKHARLHQELYDLKYAKPLGDSLDEWKHTPLNAAVCIAAAVRHRIAYPVTQQNVSLRC